MERGTNTGWTRKYYRAINLQVFWDLVDAAASGSGGFQIPYTKNGLQDKTYELMYTLKNTKAIDKYL